MQMHSDDSMESLVAHGRTLQQGAAVITQVRTFDELVIAIKDGHQDIELIDHMDATSRPLLKATIQGQEYKHLLPAQIAKTRSIRVRPGTAVPLAQCMHASVHSLACVCRATARSLRVASSSGEWLEQAS